MIPGEGGRGTDMKGGAASCPPAKCCLGELLKQCEALIYSHPKEARLLLFQKIKNKIKIKK
jgi:hypothetical protein